MIKVSAPGKLMLLGEHAVVHGRPCLVTATDHRMAVELAKRRDTKIVLNAPDVGIKRYAISTSRLSARHPRRAAFVLTAVRNFYERYGISRGLDIRTASEFSATFGLGSSSAVTVAMIKGLAELFKIKIKKRQIFDLAYKTVLDIQGVGSGFDVAAAVWGGTLYFKTGGKVIKPLRAADIPLVVGYTGIKADTAALIRKVKEKLDRQPLLVNGIFDKHAAMVESAVRALEAANWFGLGSLFNIAQACLEQLDISSPELTRLIVAARRAGALGAKLSGAGGGDCMIALADDEAVEAAITAAGGEIIPTRTGVKGVQVEKV
jgi:mevalonate kinase